MPTMEYVLVPPVVRSANLPLALAEVGVVDVSTTASKRRRLSPPQDVAGGRNCVELNSLAQEQTTSNAPKSSAGSNALILDCFSQMVHRYSAAVSGQHALLWNQFQYLQKEFVQLTHQLQYVQQTQLSNTQQLEQARQCFNAVGYYNLLPHYHNRQQEIVKLQRRIQQVQQTQRSLAEATMRLQQDQQKVYTAYNLAVKHLDSLQRSHKQEQEEQNTTNINCNEIVPNDPDVTELIKFHPGLSDRDWAKAGAEIGHHAYLQRLNFDNVCGVPRADWEAFMSGVSNNRSIRSLELISCNGVWNGSWGNMFKILTPFIEHNTNLSRLSVANSCLLPDNEIHTFASILDARGGGSNLQDIDFSGIFMNDEVAAELISSFNNLPQLCYLDLSLNCIAMRGCEALAALLRRPQSKLEALKLGSNNIGDKEVEVLAKSLSSNTALTTLALSNCGQGSKSKFQRPRLCCNSITPKGWAALSNVIRVCNHTLQSVTASLPQVSQALESTNELGYLLNMNRKEDKKAVAEQKAILIKDIIGIEFGDTLKKKVLPNIIARITRSSNGSGSELVPVFVLIRNTLSLWSE